MKIHSIYITVESRGSIGCYLVLLEYAMARRVTLAAIPPVLTRRVDTARSRYHNILMHLNMRIRQRKSCLKLFHDFEVIRLQITSELKYYLSQMAMSNFFIDLT
jgi:polysaccharide deacetylase 2 family uncharacterized protein YibQ